MHARSLETIKESYSLLWVITADQIVHTMANIMPQKMHATRPNLCERGNHSRGPTATPAAPAES
jgi:hypothetical protein